MVDFKYHVVSIVAVFLALAVGIVLGTNVLSGDVLKNLKTQTSQLRKEAQDLRAQTDTQQAQVAADQAFAQALEPITVAGRLAGRSVVVITLPNAQKAVRDASMKTLVAAGATVSGQIDITGSYVDPQQLTALDQLVTTLAQAAPDPAVASGADPAAADAPARAGALLAAALVAADHPQAGTGPAVAIGSTAALIAVSSEAPALSGTSSSTKSSSTKSASASPKPTGTRSLKPSPLPSPGTEITAPPTPTPSPLLDAASTEVLAGLEKGGFIKIQQEPTTHVGLVLIIAAPAPDKPDPSTAASDKALLELVAAFPLAGGATVLAGPSGSANSGGLVAAMRANAPMSRVVSGVDDADVASGRIAMVFALQWQKLGQAGQFGTGQGAQGPLPTPPPT